MRWVMTRVFAGACAGQQQHRAIDGLDAFALLRVHVVEKAGHGGHSTLYVNRLAVDSE
jgi:hypothetical protein